MKKCVCITACHEVLGSWGELYLCIWRSFILFFADGGQTADGVVIFCTQQPQEAYERDTEEDEVWYDKPARG